MESKYGYYDARMYKKYRRAIRLSKISLILSILSLGLSVYNLCTLSTKNVRYITQETAITKIDERPLLDRVQEWQNLPLCDSTIMVVMDGLGMQHKHIVYAQMRLESGNFQSDLSKSNNNFFGMKKACQRVTTATKKDNGYAYYEHWSLSVMDYAIWQRKYAYNLTEEEYLAKLGNVYAEDEHYINKVQEIAYESMGE